MLKRVCAAIFGIVALGASASADDLRACSQEEQNKATLAPMPKDHLSLNDYASPGAPRGAGYLVSIDKAGLPTVVCAIDAMTHPAVREPGAKAVAKFVYYPEDATQPGALNYVHLEAHVYGLSIPSLLPRATDPNCSTLEAQVAPLAGPIYAPHLVYQRQNLRDQITGHGTIVMLVKDSGAVSLPCQIDGSNVSRLAEAMYYNAASFRFPADAGRPPFYFRMDYKFQID